MSLTHVSKATLHHSLSLISFIHSAMLFNVPSPIPLSNKKFSFFSLFFSFSLAKQNTKSKQNAPPLQNQQQKPVKTKTNTLLFATIKRHRFTLQAKTTKLYKLLTLI
jgi:hypothetical protein